MKTSLRIAHTAASVSGAVPGVQKFWFVFIIIIIIIIIFIQLQLGCHPVAVVLTHIQT
jgi:t-SNARE complex subunit (syntaxin)